MIEKQIRFLINEIMHSARKIPTAKTILELNSLIDNISVTIRVLIPPELLVLAEGETYTRIFADKSFGLIREEEDND